jgi:hypothetical protein
LHSEHGLSTRSDEGTSDVTNAWDTGTRAGLPPLTKMEEGNDGWWAAERMRQPNRKRERMSLARMGERNVILSSTMSLALGMRVEEILVQLLLF